MDLTVTKENGIVTIALSGRLDTVTAPQAEKAMEDNTADAQLLVFDLAELTYTSSAGLRVLLKAQKRMNRQGSMVVRNVCPEIMEIFEVTGFSDFLTIEAAG